jgi:hypothetical protein
MKRLNYQCERCPPPSRQATYRVTLEDGTRRVKQWKERVCTACYVKLLATDTPPLVRRGREIVERSS